MIERCEYCGTEERYGHTAVCVMNDVLDLRAKLTETHRLLWLIVKAEGGITLERHDLEEYPSDSSGYIKQTADPGTGDVTFEAMCSLATGKGRE